MDNSDKELIEKSIEDTMEETKSARIFKEIIEPTNYKEFVESPYFDVDKLNTEAKTVILFLNKSNLAGNIVFIDSFYIYQGDENYLWKKDSGNYLNQKAVAIMLQQEDPSVAGLNKKEGII